MLGEFGADVDESGGLDEADGGNPPSDISACVSAFT